jgi:transcription antitermination protein NusB
MGSRRKARESALQMLFAADVMSGPAEDPKRRARPSTPVHADELVRDYWAELGEADVDEGAREFATRLVVGALANLKEIDERIKSRAEHWRISRMAVVDRNVLRLAVYEFLFEPTPRTVIINEALEVARRFSSFEATQFINGILDAIKRDLDRERPQADSDTEEGERPAEQSAAPADEESDEPATDEPEDDREQSASVS